MISLIPRYSKIIVELIPESSFGRNVRSEHPKEWDVARQLCYIRAKHRCEICGDKGVFHGFKHCVEAHELWVYESATRTQRLTDIVALCPLCHKAHHLGFAEMQGKLIECFDHIKKINKISNSQVVVLWKKAQELWTIRSQIKWELDMTFLFKFIKENKKHKASWVVN